MMFKTRLAGIFFVKRLFLGKSILADNVHYVRFL